MEADQGPTFRLTPLKYRHRQEADAEPYYICLYFTLIVLSNKARRQATNGYLKPNSNQVIWAYSLAMKPHTTLQCTALTCENTSNDSGMVIVDDALNGSLAQG